MFTKFGIYNIQMSGHNCQNRQVVYYESFALFAHSHQVYCASM